MMKDSRSWMAFSNVKEPAESFNIPVNLIGYSSVAPGTQDLRVHYRRKRGMQQAGVRAERNRELALAHVSPVPGTLQLVCP